MHPPNFQLEKISAYKLRKVARHHANPFKSLHGYQTNQYTLIKVINQLLALHSNRTVFVQNGSLRLPVL